MSIPYSINTQQVVFENQRRGFFYPFSFKGSSLGRFERPIFSNEAGEATSVSHALECALSQSSFTDESEESSAIPVDLRTIETAAPPGFEWASDWSIDKTYTKVLHI